MPLLFIHAINSEFRSRDDGAEYDKPEDALAHAIRSATALAVDEIHSGEVSAAIEIRIEQADGTAVLRTIVSMSVAAIMPAS